MAWLPYKERTEGGEMAGDNRKADWEKLALLAGALESRAPISDKRKAGWMASLNDPAQQKAMLERMLDQRANPYAYSQLSYWLSDRKSTRLNSSHLDLSRMPSSA